MSVVESGVDERGLKDVGGGECARRSGMSGVCAERDVRVICRLEKYHQSASSCLLLWKRGRAYGISTLFVLPRYTSWEPLR